MSRHTLANSGSVLAQVEARLATSLIGGAERAVVRSIEAEEFESAPLLNPPISTGMTETREKTARIIMKSSAVSEAEYAQLLRHLRHLLRVYCDTKITGHKPVEFGAPLPAAQTLVLFPDIEAFFLDEKLDIGKWRLEAQEASDAVDSDPEDEDEDEDEERALLLQKKSMEDLAASHMVCFVADLLVALVLISPVDNNERQRADRAMERLVKYSTLLVWRNAVGSLLTDAMLPLYRSISPCYLHMSVAFLHYSTIGRGVPRKPYARRQWKHYRAELGSIRRKRR
ncbi:hypothetical protein BKA93DRAFT_822263 [Sparassis latifolia]